MKNNFFGGRESDSTETGACNKQHISMTRFGVL